MEWPEALVSTIFAVILLAVGMLMMFNLAEPQAKYPDLLTDELEAGILATRIFNSPDCLALEQPYVENGKTKFQAVGGTIDLRKGLSVTGAEFVENELRTEVSSCLRSKGKTVVNYEIADLAGKVWVGASEGFGTRRVGRFTYVRNPDSIVRDYYFVRLIEPDGTISNGQIFVEVAFYR